MNIYIFTYVCMLNSVEIYKESLVKYQRQEISWGEFRSSLKAILELDDLERQWLSPFEKIKSLFDMSWPIPSNDQKRLEEAVKWNDTVSDEWHLKQKIDKSTLFQALQTSFPEALELVRHSEKILSQLLPFLKVEKWWILSDESKDFFEKMLTDVQTQIQDWIPSKAYTYELPKDAEGNTQGIFMWSYQSEHWENIEWSSVTLKKLQQLQAFHSNRHDEIAREKLLERLRSDVRTKWVRMAFQDELLSHPFPWIPEDLLHIIQEKDASIKGRSESHALRNFWYGTVMATFITWVLIHDTQKLRGFTQMREYENHPWWVKLKNIAKYQSELETPLQLLEEQVRNIASAENPEIEDKIALISSSLHVLDALWSVTVDSEGTMIKRVKWWARQEIDPKILSVSAALNYLAALKEQGYEEQVAWVLSENSDFLIAYHANSDHNILQDQELALLDSHFWDILIAEKLPELEQWVLAKVRLRFKTAANDVMSGKCPCTGYQFVW